MDSGLVALGLEGLWLQHESGWKRLLSRRALAELELRASFDLELLATAEIENRIPTGTVPDCERCEDVCCAGLENVVSLRLVDIAKLIDAGRTELMSKKKPRFPPALLEARPQLAELMDSQLFRTLPVMRQVGDNHVCAALSPDLRCTLHPHWPLSCERFPYSLSAVRRQIHWGTRCPQKKIGVEHRPRSKALEQAAVASYNERIRDAVLLAHARPKLDELGLGVWLTGPDEDPFEAPPRLPIVTQ